MKKSIYIFFILAAFMSISSCESIIEEKVFTTLDASKVYSTESGCETALNGVYSNFFSTTYYGWTYPEALCNLSGMYTYRVTTNIDYTFVSLSSTTPYFARIWKNMWVQISRANDVIYNVSESNINEDTKSRILGEAYFVRAMMYFDMVRLWGDLPLRTLPVFSEDEIDIPRTPKDQIYDQILNDLGTAKQYLPDPGGQKDGRPHKFAAYALTQKVYLTLAGNDPQSEYWQKSLDEGLVVFNSGAYSLVHPYSDLWNVNKQNSVESIFEIQNSLASTSGGSLTKMFLLNNTTLAPNGNTLCRAYINKETYDRHVSQYPKDPRIDATYLDSTYINKNNLKETKIYPLVKTGTASYTYIRKYIDPDYLGTTSNNNYLYLRYADVLLMLAEAENEINGPGGAYKYVNEVLSRARDRNGNGVTDVDELNPADWSGMTQEEFRDRIMYERNYEMLGELHEYFDVRRRGKEYFKKVLDYHNTYPANITAKEYTVSTDDATMERIMLLPIPLEEITTNTAISEADQNPGY